MLDHVWSCPSVVVIYIGGSVGGVKFSSWVRGPVLKAVCLQYVSLVAFGKVAEGGEKGVVGNVTYAIMPTFYLCGK